MKAALIVFSFFHRLVTGSKNLLYDWGWLKPRRAALPVVSVGSLALGGMGKTPLAMEILGYLSSRGLRPALVTRGYKGSWERKGGMLSDGRRIYGGWRQSGDEAFLVAQRCPQAGVFVGKHRLLSCERAKAAGFSTAVLDDGYQHRKLERDLDIVIFDPAEKTALREPFSGLKRAHLILLPENAQERTRQKIFKRFPSAKVVRFSIKPRAFHRMGETGPEETFDLARFRNTRALAFCGIARPDRFFAMLEALGLRLLDKLAFPDHHPYPPVSWRRVRSRVEALRPEAVITTEKDAVKLLRRENGNVGPSQPETAVPFYALRIEPVLPPEFYQDLDSVLQAKGKS